MLKNKVLYDLNDVIIEPTPQWYTRIDSRTEVDLSQDFGKISLKLPFISSPMSSVTEEDMAYSLYQNGTYGIIHRLVDKKRLLDNLKNHVQFSKMTFGYAIGLTPDSEDFQIIDNDNCKIVCVDVAWGGLAKLRTFLKILRSRYPLKYIISGNIITYEDYNFLLDTGIDACRVGIGSGSVCSTSREVGIGGGLATALDEIRNFKEKEKHPIHIIADGGIKYYGDVAKAIALGADYVMLGSMLSRLVESPGQRYVISKDKLTPIEEVLNIGEMSYVEIFNQYKDVLQTMTVKKQYYGMSSELANIGFNKDRTSEGVVTYVNSELFNTNSFCKELQGALGSTLSYTGIRNISSLYSESVVNMISHNTAIKSHPHIDYR